MILRCSNLPLFMACINSHHNPDNLLAVEEEVAAAETGTLIHAIMAEYIKTGHLPLSDYTDRLKAVAPDSYERACELLPRMMKAWVSDFSPYFWDAKLEQFYSVNHQIHLPLVGRDVYDELNLTGHLDVSECNDHWAIIVDWKTGRVHDDFYHQQAGYAYLLWNSIGKPADYTINCAVFYPDDETTEWLTFTALILQAWGEEVVAKFKEQPHYTVNRQCNYCPLSRTCPAFKVQRSTALETIKGCAGATLRQMSLEDRADTLQKFGIIKTACADFQKSIKQDVKAHGPMDTGDGREYSIVRRIERRLKVKVALPVLKEHMTADEIRGTLSISLPKCEAAVGKRAKRGLKATALTAFEKALVKAKAVFKVRQDRLECRKKVKRLAKD